MQPGVPQDPSQQRAAIFSGSLSQQGDFRGNAIWHYCWRKLRLDRMDALGLQIAGIEKLIRNIRSLVAGL